MGLPPLATVPLSERERVIVKGPQAHWFLDQLLTNRIEQLAPGDGCDALLLSPKGKIIALTTVHCLGPEDLLVDVDSARDFGMAAFLSSRIFSTRVEVEDVTDPSRSMRVIGVDAWGLVASILGSDPPEAENSNKIGRDGTLAIARAKPVTGWDVSFRKGSEILDTAWSEAPAVELELDDWESVRIAGGTLSFEPDLSAGFLPQEAAMERAVHFSKGCYLGQEAVAMAQRGRTHKRFRHLRFTGEAVRGQVFYEGTASGSITSCADREQQGFGLGPISTSVPIGASVQVGTDPGVSAAVFPIPGEVSGPQVPSARELRERLLSRPKE